MVLDAFRLAKKKTKQHRELLQLHSVQEGKKRISLKKKKSDFGAPGASGSLTTWMENPGTVIYGHGIISLSRVPGF